MQKIDTQKDLGLICIGNYAEKLSFSLSGQFITAWDLELVGFFQRNKSWTQLLLREVIVAMHPDQFSQSNWNSFKSQCTSHIGKKPHLIFVIPPNWKEDANDLNLICEEANFVFDNGDSTFISLSIRKKIQPKTGPSLSDMEGRLDSKIAPLKRAFDLAVAISILLIASPFLLIIALLIKIESKGPVIYASKRVGQNYKIFNFYKFRSMRQDADKMIDKIKDLNVYLEKDEEDTAEDFFNGIELISDEGSVDEGLFQYEENSNNSSFLKVTDDPRITRVGKFIRNTSIDEIPQLWNVIIGDMSIVGNRPLPLYEAEQLTADDRVERFMAPAGITGLWQVMDRGSEEITEEGRIQLDIQYAREHNFWKDLKILFMTFSAVVQKENQ
ncbi:MAG: sugar transferase [Bacteroidota bacterium]